MKKKKVSSIVLLEASLATINMFQIMDSNECHGQSEALVIALRFSNVLFQTKGYMKKRDISTIHAMNIVCWVLWWVPVLQYFFSLNQHISLHTILGKISALLWAASLDFVDLESFSSLLYIQLHFFRICLPKMYMYTSVLDTF